MRRNKDVTSEVFAAACGSAASVTVFLLAPLIVGRAMSEPLAWSAEDAAALVSSYFAGYLAACLSSVIWIRRFDWRLLAATSTTLLAVGVALTSILANPVIAKLLFAGAGLGAGILYTLTTCVVAESHNPTRNFGIKIVAEQVVGASLLLALPMLVGASLKALLLSIGAILLLLGSTGFALPKASVAMSMGNASEPPPAASPYRWTTLSALFVFFGTLSGFWAFVERIGDSQGLATAQISVALSIAVIAGGAGAFMASMIGERFGRSAPIVFSAVLLILSIVVLQTEGSHVTFVVALAVLDLAWNLALVYMLSTASSLDTNGRLAPYLAAALAAGAMCGPLAAASIGSYFSTNGDFNLMPTATLAITGVVLASVMFWRLDSLSKKLQAQKKQPEVPPRPQRRTP